MIKISASEVIRRSALKILAQYPEELQYGTLKAYTEQELGSVIEPDTYNKGKYRSALWNLEKLYPEYVVKANNPYGRTLFVPTKQLIKDFEQIELPSIQELKAIFSPQREIAITIEEDIDQGRELVSQYKIALITSKLTELVEYIKESGLYDLVELETEEIKHLSKKELEAIARLKLQLDILVKYRNDLFHGVFKG